MSIAVRPLAPSDRPPLVAALGSDGAFTAEETAVALELVDHSLTHGETDYAVRVADLASVAPISSALASARGGNGMLRLIIPISANREATLLVGRDYSLDAELAARLERITGDNSVDLAVQEGPKLALVG